MFRGPTKYSEYIQDVPKSIDFILKRVNAVTVSDLQAVTQAGATTTLPINTGGITSDYFQLDTTATPTLVPGMFGWNNAYGTADLRLKGNNVTLQLGQETLARVVNKTGSDLLESEYKVVRVRIASEGGAQGQRLAVVLAQGLNDPDSATTLGIVTETIPNNQEGFITVFGNVNNINTTGSLQGETWADGDVLYLSPTIAGGLTKVKPVAPQHMVVMGYVVYAHAINGKIFVKVDNGYELDELHNVLITSPANNDLLQYNSAQQVWKNVAPSIAVPTPTLAQVTTAGNTTTNGIVLGSATAITASPYTLQVVGGAGGSAIFSNSAKTQGLNINLTTAGETRIYGDYFGAGVDQKLILGTFANRATQLVLQTSGNVGINTTTDAGYKLDVNGTIRSTSSIWTDFLSPVGSTMYIYSVGLSGGAYNRLNIYYNSVNGFVMQSDGGGGGSRNMSIFGGGPGGVLNLGTNGAARWTLLSSYDASGPGHLIPNGTNTYDIGNSSNTVRNLYSNRAIFSGSVTASASLANAVSIANTLVAAANNDVLVGLDINPTFTNGAFTGVTNTALRVTGNTTLNGNINITSNNGSIINQNSYASNIFTVKAVTNTTDIGGMIINSGTGDCRFGSFRVGGGYYTTFYVNNAELIRLSTSNNVLIGTTTDAGYKLDVNGTARVQGVLTGTANINGLTVSNNNSNPVIGSDGTNVLIGSNQLYRIVFSSNRIDFKVSDGTNPVNAGSFTSSGSLYVGGNASTTAKLQVSGSVTASTALAQGVFFNNTLVAAANNDVLVGLDINPTFTNGAFTGITNWGIRVRGLVSAYEGLTTYNNTAANTYAPLINNTARSDSSPNYTFYGYTALGMGFTNTDIALGFFNSGLKMKLFSTGNLSIGTTTDAGYKLDVNGTARVLGTHRVWRDNQIGDIDLNLYNGQAGWQGGMYYHTESGGANQRLTLYSGGAIGTADALTINASSRNVGIGTISPSYKLHVVGSAFINTNTASTSSILRLTDNNNGTAWFGYSSIATTGFFIGSNGTTTIGKVTGDNSAPSISHAQIVLNQLGNSSLSLVTNVANTGIVFSDGVNATIRMNFPSSGEAAITTISSHNLSIGVAASVGSLTSTTMKFFQSTGNVAIGSTTDTGEKLQVNGSIKSSALTLNGPVLATGGVLSSITGYTGLFTVPTNPPGMQTLDIQNGIIVNVL